MQGVFLWYNLTTDKNTSVRMSYIRQRNIPAPDCILNKKGPPTDGSKHNIKKQSKTPETQS